MSTSAMIWNPSRSVGHRTCGKPRRVEPEVAVGLFVELLEDERVLEADPPGGSGLNETLLRMKKTVVSYTPSATTRSTGDAPRFGRREKSTTTAQTAASLTGRDYALSAPTSDGVAADVSAAVWCRSVGAS